MDTLEPLLDRAKELEKKFEWLQAAEIYQKASTIFLTNNDLLKVPELSEQIGFCYYKAAFQAQSNTEFKERLKLAIQAYDKEIRLLGEAKAKKKQLRIKRAKAWAVYTKSWLETSALKRKELLDKWWTLENQVLNAYESIGDVHSVGIVCTEMIELSLYTLPWLSDYSELAGLEKQSLRLIDKAIQSLSKSGDDYELASAYCFASVSLSFGRTSIESVDELLSLFQRGRDYLEKALELSQKIGDARLIGYSYVSAMNIGFGHVWNNKLALEYSEKIRKYGVITKENFLMGYSIGIAAHMIVQSSVFLEDPDKRRENLLKARKLAKENKHLCQITNHVVGFCASLKDESRVLTDLAAIETDHKSKERLLENAIEIIQEGFQFFKEWKKLSGSLNECLSTSLRLLSEIKKDVEEKKSLLLEAQRNQKKYIADYEEFYPFFYGTQSRAYIYLCIVQHELAKIESGKKEKIALLNEALSSWEKSNELVVKSRISDLRDGTFVGAVLWRHNDRLGTILQQIYSLTKEQKALSRAIEAYKTAASSAERAELSAHAAESHWHTAYLLSWRGEHQEACQSYKSASEAYDIAGKKIPQLKVFYKKYSAYMQAWSQISHARYSHSIEEYTKARDSYDKAAKLHELSQSWSYLAPNYSAWANMEEAESLSRKEKIQQAKQAFQKALEQFSKAEESIKQKLEKITSTDEKEVVLRLFNASDLRCKYCRARILLEDAKLLDREGKYLQSSGSYGEAAKNLSAIVDKVDVETERKELEYLATLCRAWEKMAVAEEATSSESYLEAARLFEEAKRFCHTKKASLWVLGNSNFCKGLAAGVRYQTDLELEDHARAKSFMKSASTNYSKAGFKAASEYARATQRLFDAYVFMNQAESELNQEKRAKQYQMAENLLQVAAGSFVKAKQPEKTAQVQQMLETVREEKALAVSLNEVLHAPTITSSTMSFAAPTPTNEASVGLEQFEHANVQANLAVGLREVRVGESFCLSVEFVNAGREPALLMRVEDFVPPDFIVAKKPEIYRLEESCLNMKGKQIAPLKLVEAKLVLQPSKKGLYQLKPTVHYLDELGQSRVLQLKSVVIRVEEVVLAGRVSTGTKELDSLLLGGFPKEYAVVLTGSPSDERELLIKNFLEAGVGMGGASFYVTTEAGGLERLLGKSGFFLFLCNLRPKVEVPNLPNVYKLHGKTDLNNLGIALVKAYRRLSKKPGLSRRVCVQILSDVLVNFGSKTARKWVSELITDLCSKGFTLLAVLDSSMHPVDQANAVLNLFDGEISLTQREDPLEGKSVVVRKLRNQDFIKNSICLCKSR